MWAMGIRTFVIAVSYAAVGQVFGIPISGTSSTSCAEKPRLTHLGGKLLSSNFSADQWKTRAEAEKAGFEQTYRGKDACAHAVGGEEDFDRETLASDDTNTSNPDARSRSWLPAPLDSALFQFSKVTFSHFPAAAIPSIIVDPEATERHSTLEPEDLRVCATLLVEAKYLENSQGLVREETVNERGMQFLIADWLHAAARVYQFSDVQFLDSKLTLCVNDSDNNFSSCGHADTIILMGDMLPLSIEVKTCLDRCSYLAEVYMQCLALSAANVTKAHPDRAGADHSWNIEELDKVSPGFRAPGVLFTLFKLHITVPKGSREFYHEVVPETSIVQGLIGLLQMLANSDHMELPESDQQPCGSCRVDSAFASPSLQPGAGREAGEEVVDHTADVRGLLSTPRVRGAGSVTPPKRTT